jgi:hypothetical protein
MNLAALVEAVPASLQLLKNKNPLQAGYSMQSR